MFLRLRMMIPAEPSRSTAGVTSALRARPPGRVPGTRIPEDPLVLRQRHGASARRSSNASPIRSRQPPPHVACRPVLFPPLRRYERTCRPHAKSKSPTGLRLPRTTWRDYTFTARRTPNKCSPGAGSRKCRNLQQTPRRGIRNAAFPGHSPPLPNRHSGAGGGGVRPVASRRPGMSLPRDGIRQSFTGSTDPESPTPNNGRTRSTTRRTARTRPDLGRSRDQSSRPARSPAAVRASATDQAASSSR